MFLSRRTVADTGAAKEYVIMLFSAPSLPCQIVSKALGEIFAVMKNVALTAWLELQTIEPDHRTMANSL